MSESPYAELLRLGATPSMIAGINLLCDDNYPPEKAVSMMAACVQEGRDPEAFARHFLKLRKAVRE